MDFPAEEVKVDAGRDSTSLALEEVAETLGHPWRRSLRSNNRLRRRRTGRYEE
jgi:hypothetical protein